MVTIRGEFTNNDDCSDRRPAKARSRETCILSRHLCWFVLRRSRREAFWLSQRRRPYKTPGYPFSFNRGAIARSPRTEPLRPSLPLSLETALLRTFGQQPRLDRYPARSPGFGRGGAGGQAASRQSEPNSGGRRSPLGVRRDAPRRHRAAGVSGQRELHPADRIRQSTRHAHHDCPRRIPTDLLEYRPGGTASPWFRPIGPTKPACPVTTSSK